MTPHTLGFLINQQHATVEILKIHIKIYFHILYFLDICHLNDNSINNLKGIVISYKITLYSPLEGT